MGGRKKPLLKGLSFFSGAMGMDLGMEAAGVKVLCAAEVDKSCRATIALNRPRLPLLSDVSKLDAAAVRSAANLTASAKIDVVYGGPPCQAFSTAGKQRGFDDARGNVFLDFLGLAADLDPTYVVIENVRGLLYAPAKGQERIGDALGIDEAVLVAKGGAIRLVCAYLKRRGFAVTLNLYNAANFGVPQARERVVITAKKGNGALPYLTPTNSNDPKWGFPAWKTLHHAIGNLDAKRPGDFLPLREKAAKYLQLLGPGQYWKHLPSDVQREALGCVMDLQGGKTGFFRRLAWDKPSPTLVTSPAMPATLLGHPDELRPLSIAEYLRIQQFPDGYQLAGNLAAQYKQVGNAVPVGLGKAIGTLLVADARGEAPAPPEGFPYSRYSATSGESFGL